MPRATIRKGALAVFFVLMTALTAVDNVARVAIERRKTNLTVLFVAKSNRIERLLATCVLTIERTGVLLLI